MNYSKDIILSFLGITLIPNMIFILLWSVDSPIPLLMILFNSVGLPVALLIVTNRINQKHNSDKWVLNYLLMFTMTLTSIYLGILNWALATDKPLDGLIPVKIDNGTKMIINLELMLALGLLSIGLLYKIYLLTRKKANS